MNNNRIAGINSVYICAVKKSEQKMNINFWKDPSFFSYSKIENRIIRIKARMGSLALLVEKMLYEQEFSKKEMCVYFFYVFCAFLKNITK